MGNEVFFSLFSIFFPLGKSSGLCNCIILHSTGLQEIPTRNCDKFCSWEVAP